MVRAKFKCNYKQDSQNPTESGGVVHFNAVYGDCEENKTWSKTTPGAYLQMTINNVNAYIMFEQGQEYFIDFTKA